MLPFCVAIIWYGSEFAVQSFEQGEREGIFLGKPWRWIVKSMLPFGLFLLFTAGAVVFTRNVRFLLGRSAHPAPTPPEADSAPEPETVS